MAATTNTTPANDGVGPFVGGGHAGDPLSGRKNRRHGRLPQILIIAVAAVYLIHLAYPRLHASLLFLPVDTAINNYYKTGEANYPQLEGLRQRAEEAIGANPHHRYWDGLSLLYFLSATDTSAPLFDRRGYFENSIRAAESSLKRAPSQSRTWLRIAQARSWLRYPPEQVIEALQMAVYTGRVEPSMFMTRLALGLAYLPRMDNEGTSMMRDQVLLAWKMQPRQLVVGLKSGRLRGTGISELLSQTHQSVLEEIEEAVGGPVR